MLVKIPSAAYPRQPGFSLMELILTISLLGILASVFVIQVGSQTKSVGEIKLASDVRQLNQMVSLYKADGGDLKNLTRVTEVVAKLKNYRSETSLTSHTGPASGRLLDPRMEAVTGAGQAGRPRAIWNAGKQHFALAYGAEEGAFAFELNPSRSNDAGQVDKRGDTVVKYNAASGPGWVWGSAAKETPIGYRDPTEMSGNGQTIMFNPNQPKSSGSGDSGGSGGSGDGGGGGTGDGGGGGDGPPPPQPAVKLPAPLASPSGGTYAYSGFPNATTLSSNGAPLGDSILEYRLNGGAWQSYSGSAISLSPQDQLQARNVPAAGVTAFTESDVSTDEYYRLVAGFTGAVDSTWTSAQGGTGLVSSVASPAPGVTVFTHGSTQTDLGNGEIFETGEANVLTFTASNFSNIQPNTWFNAGIISLLNGEIFNDTDAHAVTLNLDFSLSNPPSQNGTAEIRLDLINTPNSADRLASADIVRLASPSTNFTMTIDGVTYRLEVRWVSTDPSAGVVQSSGADFLVFEGGTASGRLQARFVSN